MTFSAFLGILQLRSEKCEAISASGSSSQKKGRDKKKESRDYGENRP